MCDVYGAAQGHGYRKGRAQLGLEPYPTAIDGKTYPLRLIEGAVKELKAGERGVAVVSVGRCCAVVLYKCIDVDVCA
jgi:hypothetical protein